jgi:hypothetical protein
MHFNAFLHMCVHAPAAWHLAWVRVVNLATGQRALFPANSWLDATLPGSSTWTQLPATPDDSATAGLAEQQQHQQPGQLGVKSDAAAGAGALKLTKAWLHTSKLGQPGYTVTFTTSNILGAGTAARVSYGQRLCDLFGRTRPSCSGLCRARHSLLPKLVYLLQTCIVKTVQVHVYDTNAQPWTPKRSYNELALKMYPHTFALCCALQVFFELIGEHGSSGGAPGQLSPCTAAAGAAAAVAVHGIL